MSRVSLQTFSKKTVVFVLFGILFSGISVYGGEDAGDANDETAKSSPGLSIQVPTNSIQEDLIGEGTHGCVRLVRDDDGKPRSVVKIMRDLFSSISFDRECKFYRAMRGHVHPNVLNALRINIDRGELELPYCRNGDLMDYLINPESQPLRSGDFRSIIRQVISGLLFLRSHGYSYGDLKAENILIELDREGRIWRIRFVDFGSVSQDGGREMIANYGTLQYQFLEAFSGESCLSGEADIYALGVLFTLLAKKHFPYVVDEEGFIQEGWLNIASNQDLMVQHWENKGFGFRIADFLSQLLCMHDAGRFRSLESVIAHPFMWMNELTGLNFDENMSPAEREEIMASLSAHATLVQGVVPSLTNIFPLSEAIVLIVAYMCVTREEIAPTRNVKRKLS